MFLSIVVPVYNEAESLDELYRQIKEVVDREGYEMELLLIDDGSSDGSWKRIERLSAADSRVRGTRFRRNFGKAAALTCGFEQATGEIVMTLDADLQDDPSEIPRFLEKLNGQENGEFAGCGELDVVSGWKKVRHDPWHKVLPSRVFNWMVSKLTKVKLHDHNCGMKAYRREIFNEVRIYGEMHRFVPVLAASRGWRVGELVITHRAREFGYSKYGFSRFIKGFLDLFTVKFLTGYGERPQHFFGTIGFLLVSISSIILASLAGWWAIANMFDLTHTPLHQRPLITYALAGLLMGAQFSTVGFIGELLVSYNNPAEKAYSISQKTEEKEESFGEHCECQEHHHHG